MKILRIENEEGEGFHTSTKKINGYLYCLTFQRDSYLPDGTERKQHPDTEEFYKYTTKNHYYGFKNIHDLNIWLSPEEVGILKANGFNIYIYDIAEEHVLFGKRQIAFLKEKALKVGIYKRNMRYL